MLPENSQEKLCLWVEQTLSLSGVKVDRALSGGNSNLTLLIKSDTERLVLRTAPEAAISPKAHKGVERESVVMAAIDGQVKVPTVRAWCEDSAIIGRPFLLVSLVEGVSITSKLPAAYPPGIGTLNAIGEQLVDELAAIHSLDWRAAGLQQLGNPDGFLRRQLDRWTGIRQESSVRSLPLLFELASWLGERIPDNAPVSLIHGDYHLDNTLFLESSPTLSAVIDWELASIGDPLTDLGLLLMFWGERGKGSPGFAHIQAVSRLSGVVSRRTLAERWAQRTGFSIEHLDFYMCFAFWRLAAIVEGAYALYTQGKVDTEYARNLEYDVPALLAEAAAASQGDW